MTAYAVQSPPHAGAQITYTSPPASADTMPTGSGVALLVKNPAAGTTVTVAATLPNVDGLTGPTRTVSIAAGQDFLIPFPASVYGPGPVALTYTGTLTSVQVAAVVVPGS